MGAWREMGLRPAAQGGHSTDLDDGGSRRRGNSRWGEGLHDGFRR